MIQHLIVDQSGANTQTLPAHHLPTVPSVRTQENNGTVHSVSLPSLTCETSVARWRLARRRSTTESCGTVCRDEWTIRSRTSWVTARRHQRRWPTTDRCGCRSATDQHRLSPCTRYRWRHHPMHVRSHSPLPEGNWRQISATPSVQCHTTAHYTAISPRLIARNMHKKWRLSLNAHKSLLYVSCRLELSWDGGSSLPKRNNHARSLQWNVKISSNQRS